MKKRPAIALVVHGHFYQPPRENPWTDQVPREPSAAPFPNWNARIHAYCKRLLASLESTLASPEAARGSARSQGVEPPAAATATGRPVSTGEER